MVSRVTIGGCRYYNDYNAFCNYVDMCLSRIRISSKIVILSGHCSGTDTLAEKYANENGFSLEVYPAQWKLYGRSAGPIRNEQMVNNCDFVIAFWDGKSKGTKSLIQCAREKQKPLRIKYI